MYIPAKMKIDEKLLNETLKSDTASDTNVFLFYKSCMTPYEIMQTNCLEEGQMENTIEDFKQLSPESQKLVVEDIREQHREMVRAAEYFFEQIGEKF